MARNRRGATLPINLQEDAAPAGSTVNLVESTPLVEAATEGAPTSSRFRARLIEGNVWGSSGYYSRELLESAVAGGVFAEGTPIFMDHPTLTEREERPVRSVRDLAGRLTGTAVYEDDGVYSDIEVYPHFGPIIESMADAIGMSIRAAGQVEAGEAAGRSGLLVSSLDYIASVDFVTEAGAGGKVVSLLESARVNDRAVRNHGLEEATVNDRREALSTIVKDAYAADKTWVWLRDFDDTTAWFDIESTDDSATWSQPYASDSEGIATALTGARTEVRPVTTYVPVDPAGQSTEESKEDTMPQIEEARLRELEEASGRVPQLENELTEAQTEIAAANRRAALAEARTTARERATTRVTEANGDLPEATVARIVEAAMRDLPLTDDNELDEAAFDAAVDTARSGEETYLASLNEGSDGKVTGFGRRTKTDEASLEEANTARAAAFGRTQKGA